MFDEEVSHCPELTEQQRTYLGDVYNGLELVADISRSDALLFLPCGDQIRIVAHARPHSVAPVYPQTRSGEIATETEETIVRRVQQTGRHTAVHRQLGATEAPLVSEYWPLAPDKKKVLAVLAVEATQLAAARQENRDPLFQHAVRWLQQMERAGRLPMANTLDHRFSGGDGIILVDGQRYIRYLSGVAANIYRKMGYMGDLRGWRLADLQNIDNLMVIEAGHGGCCQQEEVTERGRILIKQVIPLYHTPWLRERIELRFRGWRWPRQSGQPLGALILIHDITEIRAAQQALETKNTMIKEIHHRVKNNLQTVASLLRMQSRRAKQAETRQMLQEAIGRVRSVAVIHDFLSRAQGQTINMREVCRRIVAQVGEITAQDEQKVRIRCEGEAVFLPAQEATALALVINELLLNALEHAFVGQKTGEVTVWLHDWGNQGELVVEDNGQGLPEDWQGVPERSLGLQIIQSLAEHDLSGTFSLEPGENGTIAKVTFAKK